MMESTIKKLFVTTSIFVGAATAFVPLTSYAATTDTKSPQVSVEIPSVLTFDASGNSDPIKVTPNVVGTGTLSTTVAANSVYTISLKANSAALTNLTHETNSNSIIPAASGTLTEDGVTGWGIKMKNSDGSDQATYTGLTTSDQTFYTSATPTKGTTLEFEIGIAANGGLQDGTYSTNVVVTAASAYSK